MARRLVALAVAAPFVLGAAASPSGAEGEVVTRFADRTIVESSGLVAADGLFVTVNDSGDGGRVFAVDAETGETVGVSSWDGEPRDVEALAPAGAGEVWVGDIGDNRGVRDSVEVLRVPVGRGERQVSPQRYRLTYPDGAQDAESLLVHPDTGRLLVISKSFFGGTVYAAPARLRTDGENRLREVGRARALATDAAFFPDGRHLVVRGYSGASVLTWPTLEEVADLDLPRQEQGEGIAVAADGEVYLSSEGLHAPVLRLPLPADVREAMAAPTAAGQDADPGSPSRTEPASAADGAGAGERSAWPWLAGGLGLALLLAALLRALRPR